MSEPKQHPAYFLSEDKDVKAPNIVERAKEEVEAIIHNEKKSHHHKETHGRSSDIDEDIPNVFERVKEEVKAIVGAIHPKILKDPGSSSKQEEVKTYPEKDTVKFAFNEDPVVEVNLI